MPLCERVLRRLEKHCTNLEKHCTNLGRVPGSVLGRGDW